VQPFNDNKERFIGFLVAAVVCLGFSIGLGYFYLRDLKIYKNSGNERAFFYDKDCWPASNKGDSRSTLMFTYNGEKHEMTVSEKICKQFETGRQHSVYHIEEYSDVFLLDKPNPKKGYGALGLLASVALFSLLSYAQYKGINQLDNYRKL
jgi:hypothetical protein